MVCPLFPTLGVIGFSAPTEVANVANGELVAIDNSGSSMRDISSPVLVVRGSDGGRPGKKYRVGNCVDGHGSPVPTAYDCRQCSKRNKIQGQARCDAHSGRLRQLIRDREVCPNRRKKQTRYQCAGSENSQHASDQFHHSETSGRLKLDISFRFRRRLSGTISASGHCVWRASTGQPGPLCALGWSRPRCAADFPRIPDVNALPPLSGCSGAPSGETRELPNCLCGVPFWHHC